MVTQGWNLVHGVVYCTMTSLNLIYCIFLHHRRKSLVTTASLNNNNLLSRLHMNYLFCCLSANIVWILSGSQSFGLFGLFMLPAFVQWHVSGVIFYYDVCSRHTLKCCMTVSLAVLAIGWLALLVLIFVLGAYNELFGIYAVGWGIIFFIPVLVGWCFFYYAVKKQGKLSRHGKILLWNVMIASVVYIGVSIYDRLFLISDVASLIISHGALCYFFVSLTLFADHFDSLCISELTFNYVFGEFGYMEELKAVTFVSFSAMLSVNLNKNDDNEKSKGKIDNMDEIEAILTQLSHDDWSAANKLNYLPKSWAKLNSLIFLILDIVCILLLLVELIMYFLFIVVPLFVVYLFNILFFCWFFSNEKFHKSFKDYYFYFMTRSVEYLSFTLVDNRGFVWKICYYIITFGEGIITLLVILAGDINKQIEYYRYRRKLSNDSNEIYPDFHGSEKEKKEKKKQQHIFFGADGGLNCGDYNVTLKHYNNGYQGHEFAGRYKMHPSIELFCPIYSLGQNQGTNIHNFIRESMYNINNYLLRSFDNVKIPDTLYLPNKNAGIDDLYGYALSQMFYRLFEKELSLQNIKTFSESRKSLLSIGVIPNSILNKLGYKKIPRQYWDARALVRNLMLKEHINHEIPRTIIKTAIKYGFETTEEFNYAINSFSNELFPGIAAISSITGIGLKHFGDGEDFRRDPLNFVLEAARYSGLPVVGRTVLTEVEKIKMGKNNVCKLLRKGQSIIHRFDDINRCPYIFKNNPDKFNPNRKNLHKNIFTWGNREEYILNGSATRSCPLHNYAILAIQELIARLYGMNDVNFELYQGLKDKISYKNTFDTKGVYDHDIEIVMEEYKNINEEKEETEDDKKKLKISQKDKNSNENKNKNKHKNKDIGLDTFQTKLIPILATGVNDWNKNPPINVPRWDDQKIDKLDGDKYPLSLEKDSLFGVIKFPMHDVDLERDCFKDFVLKLFSNQDFFPIKDDAALFKDLNEMYDWKNDNSIPTPPPNVLFKETFSDEMVSCIAFASVGCHYMKKIDEIDDMKNSDMYENNVCYVSDFTAISKYTVRKTCEIYGARAHFDFNFQLVSIYVSFLDKLIYPTDGDLWEFAKYVYKTSMIVHITVVDHAGFVHSIEANYLVTCTRENLPIFHPFRRLLDIFTYRTININYGVKLSLLENGMLIHRLGGLDIKGLKTAFGDIADSYKFMSPTERVDKSMLNVSDSIFPIVNDSKKLNKIMCNLVVDWINLYYQDENDFINDKYIKLFYRKLSEKLKINNNKELNKLSIKSFVYVIGGLITTVTGYHELVGGVMDLAGLNPKWLDSKIYKYVEGEKPKLEQSKNDFALLVAVVMLTGLKQPKLINDFSHVIVKDSKYEDGQAVLRKWQVSLKQLEAEIDKKNEESRRIAFNSFNPRVLECSVSI